MNMGETEELVSEKEWLARYVVLKHHVRADGTIKPDPFIPYKWTELSVTRHIGLREEEIWAVGHDVARQLGKELQGRGDTTVDVFYRQKLRVKQAPEPNNPNHANVINWPGDKQGQKEIALEIVKDVQFKPATTDPN